MSFPRHRTAIANFRTGRQSRRRWFPTVSSAYHDLKGIAIVPTSRELCVIYNPTAGKHRAARRLEPLRRAWGERAAFRPTERSGHAAELARQAALEGFA